PGSTRSRSSSCRTPRCSSTSGARPPTTNAGSTACAGCKRASAARANHRDSFTFTRRSDMTEELVLADDPRPRVRRITLNRPEKRNAMSNLLRAQLFDELRRGDQDNDVSVMVVRGAGVCFSAGYDLNPDPNQPLPRPIAIRDGFWSRSLVEGWFEMMDMATPIIAQVHGYCL